MDTPLPTTTREEALELLHVARVALEHDVCHEGLELILTSKNVQDLLANASIAHLLHWYTAVNDNALIEEEVKKRDSKQQCTFWRGVPQTCIGYNEWRIRTLLHEHQPVDLFVWAVKHEVVLTEHELSSVLAALSPGATIFNKIISYAKFAGRWKEAERQLLSQADARTKFRYYLAIGERIPEWEKEMGLASLDDGSPYDVVVFRVMWSGKHIKVDPRDPHSREQALKCYNLQASQWDALRALGVLDERDEMGALDEGLDDY